MDVADWIDAVDAFHPVRLEDSRTYVAVCYRTQDGTEADLVPTPTFRSMARPALKRAAQPRYVDTSALKRAAEGHGYGEEVERWIDHDLIPDHRPPAPPWDRALRYAGYGAGSMDAPRSV